MVREDIIILLAGLPGSGKSVVSGHLADRGITKVVMGDIIRSILKERGIPITQENMLREAIRARIEHGPEGVALMTIKFIREKGIKPPIVIDGLRSLHELKAFVKELPGCHTLFYVHSSPMKRFARLKSRGREGDPKSIDEFIERDRQEIGFGLSVLSALADYVFINESTIEELKAQVDKALESIRECTGELLSRYL